MRSGSCKMKYRVEDVKRVCRREREILIVGHSSGSSRIMSSGSGLIKGERNCPFHIIFSL